MAAIKINGHAEMSVNQSNCIQFDPEKLSEAFSDIETVFEKKATKKQLLAFKVSKRSLFRVVDRIREAGKSKFNSKKVELYKGDLKTLAEAPPILENAYEDTKKMLKPWPNQRVREFLDGVNCMLKTHFGDDPMQYCTKGKKLTK